MQLSQAAVARAGLGACGLRGRRWLFSDADRCGKVRVGCGVGRGDLSSAVVWL